jgi:penicillin-binding protein 2
LDHSAKSPLPQVRDMLSQSQTRQRFSDHHTIKDHQLERRIFSLRLFFMVGVILVLFGILLYRFYNLQVHFFADYALQSDRNRIQVRPVAPNRGLIRDGNGEILAENKAVQTLSLVRERIDDLDATINRLSSLVEISDRDLETFHKTLSLRRHRPYTAIPLKYNLSDEELARLAVVEHELDGVEVQGHLVRAYPHEDLFAHTVGYVGSINANEQANFDKSQRERYAATSRIGKIGLEKYYEAQLHGDVGQENIETDARGRILRVLETDKPIAGADLDLFLRRDLQKKAVELLADRRGSVVAIDVQTGGVLTMVSAPSFDPNAFVLGISQKDYSKLIDNRDLPMFNRAIQGQYPAGSTVKPMLGLAGLQEQVITPDFSIKDYGYYQLENDDRLYREWKRDGHGAKVNLYQAIVESCDIFFYDMGWNLGVDRMHPAGVPFGLGHKTNIDIPSERSGLWPSREWKRNVRGLAWYPGNSLNMSIGQGDVLTTPLQLAVMTATLARKGEMLEPRLVHKINGEELELIAREPYYAEEEHWALIFKSMRDVLAAPKGTAHSISSGMTFSMAGKTGTAQVVSIAQDEEYDSEALSERNRDHALFVAFAPIEEPKIAISVVIENGEKSSQAAKVARELAELYLESVDE